jgi:hypothetical protein
VTVALLSLLAAACQKSAQKIVVPEVFRVKFQTSQGDFIVEASRAWAPRGADRFHELVNMVPFGKVVEGMVVIDKLYSGYGELRPQDEIDPGRVEEGTNAYLVPRFPKLDYIERAVFLP